MYAPDPHAAKRRWVAGIASEPEQRVSLRRAMLHHRIWQGWQNFGLLAPVVCVFVYALLLVGMVMVLAAIARIELGARASVNGLLDGPEHPLQAGSYHRRAAALLQNSFGAEDIGAAEGLIDLAGVYLRQQRYAEAESLYDRALVILMHNLGAEDPQVTDALTRLAELHLARGNSVMASAVLEFLYSVRERDN